MPASASEPWTPALRNGHYALVNPDTPTVDLTLWRADAIVLFDWLMRTDLNAIEIEHPAEKQALADLLTRLEVDTDVASVTQDEIDTACSEIAKDMGW